MGRSSAKKSVKYPNLLCSYLGLPTFAKQGRSYSSLGFPVSPADATLGTFSIRESPELNRRDGLNQRQQANARLPQALIFCQSAWLERFMVVET